MKEKIQTRRAKGFGTVFKIKRKSGDVYGVKITRNGVTDRVPGTFRTKAEAERELKALQAQSPGAKTFPSLGGYIQSLLEGRFKRALSISRTTWETMESHWRNHIATSDLGAIRLDLVKQRDVQAFVDGLSMKGLMPSTIKRVGSVVSRSLSEAVKDEYIVSSPHTKIDYPTIEETRKRSLTLDEAATITQQIWSQRFRGMVEVSIRTGLRRGEVCGLKWRHIDAANLLIHLDSQLILDGGKVVEGPVKERRAKGAIPIDRDLLETLQAQPQRSEYVFTTEDGKPIRPDNYSRDWKQFRARLAKRGVNTVGLTLHSLRTTFISLHLQNQTDIRTIAELVNHADPAFTLRKYARSNDEVKRKAQNRLANELKKRRKRAQQNHPQPADPANAKRSH